MNNIPNKTDNTGDTLPANDFNPLKNELQTVVTDTGQTLDVAGTVAGDQTQLSKAMAAYGASADFYQDSGTANSYVLERTTNIEDVPGPLNGLSAVFKVGNTNTGGSTVNWPGVGIKNITTTVGSALSGGELPVDQYVNIRYNSSNDRAEFLGALIPFASQAQQEAGTSNVVAVTPGVQQFHKSACKVWVNFQGTGTVAIRDAFNVSSVTDNGTGDYTINFTVPFSNASYSPSFGWNDGDGVTGGTVHINSGTFATAPVLMTTTQMQIVFANGVDINTVSAHIFGDQ